MSESEMYCHICQCIIVADNIEEVESGEHEGYLFIHDDIPHEEYDIEALINGIQ